MEQIKFKNDDIELDVNFSSEENTVWLSKDDMAILFKKDRSVIGKYARSMIKNGDVNASVWAKFARTAPDGKSYEVDYYNLDLITLIGQRTKSKIINTFYKWCIDNLNELRSKNMAQSNIIRFSEGKVSLDVNISPKEDTVWLNQNQIATLFGTTKQNVNLHIQNILKEGEIDSSVVKDSLTTQSVRKDYLHTADDGKQYLVTFYNLDMILAVGYRVKSKMAIAFRKWASNVLKQYLMNGYVLDENRIMVSEANYRHLVVEVDNLSKRVDDVENKVHEEINDIKEKVFIKPIKERLFYDGEYYDAYDFLISLVKKAKNKISLIDPYFDEAGLNIFKNVAINIDLTICASTRAAITSNDLLLFEKQYGNKINLKYNDTIHDRFLIIDDKECYVIGASINYMGKKTFTVYKYASDKLINDVIGLV